MPQLSVIAATDLTELSAHVSGRAARLAAHLKARLILVHVGADPGGALPVRFANMGRGRGKESVAETLAANAQSVGAEGRLLSGDPATALANLAMQENAALIVLGLHRERRVLDILRLTTMERVVLAAPCPVLIAHHIPDKDYAEVLALTGFTASSAAALIMAARIAPNARFHAVHALQLPMGAIFDRGHRDTDAALDKADLAKEAFLAIDGLPHLAEDPVIVPGGVHQVLAYSRDELEADLVCIGAHSGRDPKALGNYARDLMRAPPTDLLVAKPT